MCQPLKTIPRTATVSWCAAESHPTLMALGSSANSADLSGSPSKLDFVNFDLAKQGSEMDVLASIEIEGGRRFSSLTWSNYGVANDAYPCGILAGGLQNGVIALWNPHAIIQSRGADSGLIHTRQLHNGSLNHAEFHPMKPNLMVTCGSDSEVNILDITKPQQPEVYKPSSTNRHAGSEVLCCAWNRQVQFILCSASNTGTTVVWDLKQKREVICFQDPANRQRISSIAWHPEIATQLCCCYDDDRNPSIQMWDLRNPKYPFKETAGHSKGISSLAWNVMDPNLLMSCGKDNKMLCWCLAGREAGTPEVFNEVSSQHGCSEVKWAPHKPGLISTASSNGTVSVHSMQQQQTPGFKYCPKWYSKPSGVSFGFGGKVMAFGVKKAPEPVVQQGTPTPAKVPASTFCHSLIVPNEPEVVPAADLFESWIAERKLREYCSDMVRRSDQASHESLMWDVMSTQFEAEGRQRIPALLGLESRQIDEQAERFLGKKPGTTLMGPPAEEPAEAKPATPAAKPVEPVMNSMDAMNFFEQLADENEAARQQAEEESARKQSEEAAAAAAASAAAASSPGASAANDWSKGPEALIKQSLLVGNLTTAVECCFKSGRMAEALLLASGGGTTLFQRARDEYLRLQGDDFLSAVGNIMTSKYTDLVAAADLAKWTETLAILATYSGAEYSGLCEQLGQRLEKEKFDIRSAVICYICAGNFPKTVTIWTSSSTAGSQKLALQDLVEKMAVLQEATKFNDTDAVFNAKLTQYAEILANSGRLTAAMRYLCLLRDDASSSILRDRIFNSAPQQMGQIFGRAPNLPFDRCDLQIRYTPPAAAPKAPAYAATPGARPGVPGAHAPMPGAHAPMPGAHAQPGVHAPMSGTPAPMPGAMRAGPHHGAAPYPGAAPASVPGAYPGAAPAPRMNQNLGPAPAMPGPSPGGGVSAPSPSYGARPGGVGAPAPGYGAPAPGYGAPAPLAAPPVAAPMPAAAHGGMAYAPTPAGQATHAGAYGSSTAPGHSAKPTVEGLPVAWPLPTKEMQKLSTNKAIKAQNEEVQAASQAVALGDPMQAGDLQRVQTVLGQFLQASGQDGNTRKYEDISKRLEELYSMLQLGNMKNAAQAKVMQMVQSLESQDFATASKMQMELTATDWNENKNWLQGVKRLIPSGR